MFILTSLTRPLAARTAFSRIGVSCRHGPHHGAQKSISTGWRFDSSMTSFMKDLGGGFLDEVGGRLRRRSAALLDYGHDILACCVSKVGPF